MGGLVGLVPAAGLGKRVAFLPCSKELFPIGFTKDKNENVIKPKAVGEYLLECMYEAGARQIFIILSRGKWDILQYFGDGVRLGLHIAYLLQEKLWGMPYALDSAYPWLCGETVLFGMPDTIFHPKDAFSRLLYFHRRACADVTLGLFPTTTPERFGMVEFDNNSYRALYIVDKPDKTHLKYMWGIGCWEPTFTNFLHHYLQKISPPNKEVVLGDVFQASIEANLNIRVVPFENGEFIDIGVPDELVRAIQRFNRSYS